MIWDWLSVGLKMTGFAFVLQAVGASIFALRYSNDAVLQLNKLITFAVLFGAVVISLSQWVEPARLAASPSGLLDLELQKMLLFSPLGQAKTLRLAGLGSVALSCFAVGNGRLLLLVFGTVFSVLSFAWVGHSSTDSLRPILAIALMFHIAIAAFWFGSLLPLSRAVEALPTVDAADVLRRFSQDAFWLVPMIAVLGLFLAIALSAPVSELPTTSYGWLLLLKLTLFTALLGLGARNKFVLVPALSRDDRTAVLKLQRTIKMEILLIVLVLAATATLTSFFAPPGVN